jgi:hypothetical protein
MNCKPGDLAYIVKGNNAGRLCNVLRPCAYYGHGYWEAEMVGAPGIACYADGTGAALANIASVEDHRLRPIRDPGDDAVDESFRWVPSPAFERAYAETYGGGA